MKKRHLKVLIPSHDHSYREGTIEQTKVVWNSEYRTFSEYHGDEYLEGKDEVIEAFVAS